MADYDAIFIGSGHNALITAAYLARAGRRVLVLEKNDRPGGLVRTEELTLPGFLHDTYSSAHPLLVTGPAYAELKPELEARGLTYLNTDLPTGVSLPDGRTAVFSRDMAESIAEAERLAPGDGKAWESLMTDFGQYAGPIFGLFGLDLASPQAHTLISSLMSGPNATLSPFAGDFMRTARDLLEHTFKSEVWRAMLVPWVMHLGRGPEDANSAFWIPLTFMALQAGGMATPAGGSEMLARALARLIEDHGGEIRTGQFVDAITIKDGKATAVHTAEGEHFTASRAIVATTTPDQLYLNLLAGSDVVPPTIRKQASNYRYGLGCMQIQLALSEAPQWPDPRMTRIGQPHLTSGLDGVSRSINEATRRLLPAEPTISMDCPTQIDPSRAPAGKAIVRLQMLDVPFQPRGDAAGQIDVGDGTWTDSLKNHFADRVIALATKHIPNLESSVLARHILTPGDLPGFNPNLGQGDPYGGSHHISQSYLLRPIPSQPSHRTIVPNLYMLGAATWPGHGVNGGSGYIVAQQLLGQTD